MTKHNPGMPKDKGIDNTLDVLKEGYLYISNQAQEQDSDVFQTRLLGEKAICMRGAEAAEIFYEEGKFVRENAAPKRVLKTLFGEGGVQTLDGEAHQHRKALFMSLMTKEALINIRKLTALQWGQAIERWSKKEEVVLYREAQELLLRTACEWAGVPLDENEVAEKASWFGAMFEATAAIGPHHWKGRRARTKAEKWIEYIISDVRDNKRNINENSVLYTVTWHRDLRGELIDIETAGVELLNIIRPIVAVSVYICFTALAIHQHPRQVAKLSSSNEIDLQYFVQEVRRFYPFFPFTAARVNKDFVWANYQFEEGTLTLLDLYGTNHHPEIWSNPNEFDPARFEEWKGSPFNFIPQGGGDYEKGHRCAGEWLTLELMKESLNFLVHKVSYSLPEQDLRFSFNEIPSLPKSHFIMKNVQSKDSLD
ncbi:cytochrome P450 [Alkalicoccobacillus gibsonii]|uniref:cytochrome P450 n=1 Tax=Alkalicoccobacillus gibsonii TaxID=79881 RepID=UPI003F7BB8AC